MADEYREAKADVKAEKARAKSLRPWWKKKRFMIPLVLLVIGIAASASSSGGGSGTSGDGGGDSGSESATGAGNDLSTNEDNPPEDDVEITSCEKTVIDTVDVALRVTNNSSKESDYTISLTVEDSGGSKIGDGFASTSNVDPGQTANIEGVATLTGEGADFTCSVEEVERFAS